MKIVVGYITDDISLLSLEELVRISGAGAALSRNGRFSNGNQV